MPDSVFYEEVRIESGVVRLEAFRQIVLLVICHSHKVPHLCDTGVARC